MNFNYSWAALGILGAIILPACQHIPERPLRIDDQMKALESRELAVEPVTTYAAELSESRGDDEAAFDAEDGLELREAEAVALWYNASLRIARLEADRSAALAAVAGRWDDPNLVASGGRKRAEVDEVTDSNGTTISEPDIERTWISSAGLSITIPLSGRLAAKRRARTLAHEAAVLAATKAEWELLADLRETWFDWSTMIARRKLLKSHLEVVDQFADVSRALSAAGELAPGNARLFLIEKVRKEARMDELLAEERALRAEILLLLGLVADANVDLIPAVNVDAPAPAMESDQSLAANHPTVRYREAAYDAAEAGLRTELRKQYPDITFSPGYLKEGPETFLTLGVGAPLPVWNVNREGIAEAFANRELARAHVDNALLAVRKELSSVREAHRAANARRMRLMEQAAPIVDQQMAESQSLLRMGEADPSLLFQALLQAYELKEEILRAASDEARALGVLRAYASLASPASETEASP